MGKSGIKRRGFSDCWTCRSRIRASQSWEEAQPYELCDVGVRKFRHQLALLQVLVDHLSHTLILHINESLMELLASTDKVFVGHLEKNKNLGL